MPRTDSAVKKYFGFFFFTLVTGPRRSVSLKLSETGVYEPQIRGLLVATTHLCEGVVASAAGHSPFPSRTLLYQPFLLYPLYSL